MTSGDIRQEAGDSSLRFKKRPFLSTVFCLDSSSNGFTLIELITAIGVLAILVSAVLAAVNPLEQFHKAQDSKRKSDLAQIQRALEGYYQDYHRYPYSIQSKISTDNTTNGIVQWGSTWSPYMDVLPIEPSNSKEYAYWSDSTGQSYALYAALDRGGKDPQACNSGNPCNNATANGLLCGGTTVSCTYGVTSPNISP